MALRLSHVSVQSARSSCRKVIGSRPVVPVVSVRGYQQNNTYGATNYGWGNGSSSSSGFWNTRGKTLPANTIVKFVPQQEAWIVERMGKFSRILEPGLAILIPVLDRIRYVKSLKEVAVEIPSQSAITQDNVTLDLDGVLYYRVIDPYKASYGVEDAEFAIAQLAQTTMRAEIGQMTLDRTLAERTQLNFNIVNAINHAAAEWGIKCLRYEIRDIHPPENVVAAMHQQVSAERRKRAEILESEGARQSAINVAEGKKQSAILESEAVKAQQINHALGKDTGEAEAITLRAQATAQSIEQISKAIQEQGQTGQDAISLSVAEKYIDAFAGIAKQSTTVVVPSDVNDVPGMVTKMLTVYNSVKSNQGSATSLPSSS
ncbi:hypothetical protein HK097_009820 [Rhizophlyctis rosea]|uniref:Band 7 domain-containing protein n=1 Tax=Rhizophlyctis rosea TaxID=64517 RepID=A0AAD5X486_9FUNG|nr:hypothetical protein HK097_009820 [Rhizophlyctis rosea]